MDMVRGNCIKIDLDKLFSDYEYYVSLNYNRKPQYIVMSYDTAKMLEMKEKPSFSDKDSARVLFGIKVLFDNTLNLGEYKIVG